MPKTRILVFSTAYRPFIGGAEIAIQEVTKRLKDRFDFYIITSRFRRDLPKIEVCPEGTIIRLGFGTRFDKWLLPLFCVCTRLSLVQLYQAKPGTVVWGVDISAGAVAASWYKIFHPRAHFVFNIQYGYGEERLRRGRLGLIGIAFKLILSRADYVTAISSYLLNLARVYGYGGPAEVIPNGVDVKKFAKYKTQSTRPEGKIVITTSRLVPKNGIDVLIQAIAEIKKEISDIRCHIIGDGPERQNLESEVTRHKLEENIKFLGSIPYDDIPKYLHEADIFVRPSRSEGMGNSFVEALAAGLPIIGTSVGGITDIIQDGQTGLFARVDDPHDLAGKIKLLFKNQEMAHSLVNRGRGLVEERFSWNKIAESYSRIFTKYCQVKALKILLATPLLPPQLGGPAIYAKNLGEEFQNLGHQVKILSFGKFLRYPSGIRHLLYFLNLLRKVRETYLIFALDYIFVGGLAAIVSKITQKPLIIRVEGDFLWEHFIERTRKDVTLAQFYENKLSLSFKEKIMKRTARWTLQSAARLVFSSEWRRTMTVKAFGIPEENTAIIKNVWETSGKEVSTAERKNVILWAGRMLYLKNLHRLIRAFSRVNKENFELHLVGDGPEKKELVELVEKEKIGRVKFFPTLSHEEMLRKFHTSAFFVLPSFSDVGPTVIADALSTSTPFMMTKESGYYEFLRETGVFVDPLAEKDLEEKLKLLMDESKLREYQKKIVEFSRNRNWPDVAQDWVELFFKASNF